jgi:predicted nucleic acid-binding Zn ribbon protein
MKACEACGQELDDAARFCIRCGRAVVTADSQRCGLSPERQAEEMNVTILYWMVGALLLAVLFPPWEAPPGQQPAFLGFHFILSPPEGNGDGAVISRLLLTIELVTIAVAGFYLSWLFRKKP